MKETSTNAPIAVLRLVRIVLRQFPPTSPAEVNSESNTEIEDETPTNVYSIIGWLFYLIGVVDFCGMFFDYDFTGVSWSPIAFAGIGYIFDWLAKKNA